METNKALTADQLDKLKAAVRQRFDDLYHRIGTSRQKLATTVLLVDQSINKELNKEKIDTVREKQILNRLREIEREANNQLPHVPKMMPAQTTGTAAAIKPPPLKTPDVKTPAVKTPKTAPAKTKNEPKAKKEVKGKKEVKEKKDMKAKAKKK